MMLQRSSRISRTRRFCSAALVGTLLIPLMVHRDATAAAGDISTLAGGRGPALALGTTVGQQPRGVAVRGTDVYVADDANYVVRKLDTTTGMESVVAGDGSPGFSGDGGPADVAQLDAADVAMDLAGRIYIADRDNQRIRRIDTDGNIDTVAGTGQAGDSGDGGPAALAALNYPEGIAVDIAGNIFIADTRNHRIRKVDTSGTITAVAGVSSPLGGGGYSGDGGPAVQAKFAYPRGISIDADGNLLIADGDNGRIRKVVGGIVTTVAGLGGAGYAGDGGPATAARLRYPADVAAVPSGGFLIADTDNHRIRRVDADGTITTLAGRTTDDGKVVSGYAGDGGQATAAELNLPRAVAPDGEGNVVVGDSGNGRLRKVDMTTGIISSIAGTGEAAFGGDGGPARDAQLNQPGGTAIDAGGNVLLADTYNNRIRRVGPDGTIDTVAGRDKRGFSLTEEGGSATDAKLNRPMAVAAGANGDVFIADTGNSRIRKVTTDGTISAVAGTTDLQGSPLSGFYGDDGPATEAALSQPTSVAVDGEGNVFIADTGNHRVRKVATDGKITTVAGMGGVTLFNLGTYSGDGGPATQAGLSSPRGVAVAGGKIYIADMGNSRIRMVDKLDGTGTITTVAGNGTPGYTGDGLPATVAQLRRPHSVSVDALGHLLIADTDNHAVRKGVVGGVITTVVGRGAGEPGFDGDGGSATGALIRRPEGLSVGMGGRLVIADTGNNRIRSVQGPDAPPPVPPTIVASGGSAQRSPIGTAFSNPLKATVRDSAGRPTTGAEVTFTAPAAGPSGTFEGSATTASVTTGADGVATSPTFTANQRAGAYEVKATTPAVTGEAVFALINDHGPATSISPTAGTPQQAQVGTEFTTRLAARVVDAGANPVPGAAVTFTAPGGEPTATFDTPSGGTARTITVTSDEDGTATATALVAGSKPGSYVVSAATDGVTAAADYELTNLPEHTPFVTAVGGTPQGTRVGSDFATALQAGVRDEDNQPLAGVEVTFTTPASGPSGTFAGGASTATATTDASGVATAPTLTANDTSGSWTVSAAAVGAAGSASFSLTNNAPYPVSVRAVGGTPQSARTATDFATPLSAFVRDETDNPMGGVIVTFTAPSDEPRATFAGGANAASAITDAKGVATAPTLTAGRTEGVYTVAGRVEGVAGEALFRLANTAPPGGDPAGDDDDLDDDELDDSPPCPAVSVGPRQVAYRGGFSLVGLPEGTRLPYSPARLWAWWDEGAGGQYGARDPGEPLTGGWGYWKYFRCPTVVDVPPTPGPVELSLPLGAYHGSIVGNPADRPVTVTGHDYAARYHYGDRYRMSAYREPIVLAPGEAMWVFAYQATTIEIEG